MNKKEKTDYWELFSRQMIRLRKEQGFSKKKMAKTLEIGIGTLTKIEKGERPPRLSVEIVYNIQDAFGIIPHELFDEER